MKPSPRQIGVACEAVVLADLSMRGLEVTRPVIDSGDDWHVRTSLGWLSVQVKAKDRRRRTWSISGSKRKIKSRLLAMVDIDKHIVRYSMKGRMPRELA